jgi:uncharacterized iron-regulated membrane protein
MRSRGTMRVWSKIHTWTSVISMVFLLLLCITGLPLIFNHELNHALYDEVEPAQLTADTPPANLDKIVENGLARNPGQAVQFMFWDRDEPELIWLSIGKTVDSNPDQNRLLKLDSRTGEFLEEVDFRDRLTYVIYRLHVDMYAGLPGKLFLGLMGFLFCIAIVSGVVLYWPSTRKLDFGAMRRDRPRLVRWLDLHNLLGVVTVVWALTVGFTGVINTWADLIFKLWQNDQLVEMTQAYKERGLPEGPTSVDQAVAAAREVMPGMKPSFVAFPGNPFSSKSHYAVFMRGETPLTSRLLRPALVEAETGKLTDSRELPLYAKALLVSQPLHFGDYGGMPLKIIWAVLDIATIVVLVTGLYLWVVRIRRRRAAHPAARAAYAAAQR